MSSGEDWEGLDLISWLGDLNRELLARVDLATPDAFRDSRVTAEVVAAGWLGSPGASDDEIRDVGAGLGTALPPGYRSFLQASDGFLLPGLIVPRLRSAGELRWLRDEDPETVATWAEYAEPDRLSPSSMGACRSATASSSAPRSTCSTPRGAMAKSGRPCTLLIGPRVPRAFHRSASCWSRSVDDSLDT